MCSSNNDYKLHFLIKMHYLSRYTRFVLVLFKFLVCFFPLLAGRFSDFHQNRKKKYNFLKRLREFLNSKDFCRVERKPVDF